MRTAACEEREERETGSPVTIDLASLADWPERCYELGLTDGLPAFPPTRERVNALVAASGLAAGHSFGAVPPRMGAATVEALAANAVMAGCAPEHFPVVLAAIDALFAPEFNLRGVQVTTHGCWPLVIVGGPVVERLGMATAESVFSGGGARANAVIGRAVRLALWNLGGTVPGEPVKEVFGHPGRYSFCIAETPSGEGRSPWPGVAEASGTVPPGASAVTVFACESPHSVAMWGADDEPEHRLAPVADALRVRGSNNAHTMGETLVLLTPGEARHLDARGFDRARVQAFLFEHARNSIAELRPLGPLRPDGSPEHWLEWWPDWIDQSRDDTLVPVVERATDIHVVVSGADSIPWAAVCPGWGHLGGFAVSREVA
jgi:hypothetical protein